MDEAIDCEVELNHLKIPGVYKPDPELDRETLALLKRTGVDLDMIERVTRPMRPAFEVDVLIDERCYPWLPGYRLAAKLRRIMHVQDRKRLVPRRSAKDRTASVAKLRERLDRITNTLDKREAAGDGSIHEARVQVRAFATWLNERAWDPLPQT